MSTGDTIFEYQMNNVLDCRAAVYLGAVADHRKDVADDV